MIGKWGFYNTEINMWVINIVETVVLYDYKSEAEESFLYGYADLELRQYWDEQEEKI